MDTEEFEVIIMDGKMKKIFEKNLKNDERLLRELANR